MKPAHSSLHSNEETEEAPVNPNIQTFSVAKATEFPSERHKWNTNEEVAAILTAVEKHADWESTKPQIRPPSGSLFLFNRTKVRYRKDGYVWKRRKDGKNIREDHMKLKVQGVECIYGCYVHSAMLPTFHRRCYWLLQNQDMVLVHYLNVPLVDEDSTSASMMPPLLSHLSSADERDWSEEDLLAQLTPMLAGVTPEVSGFCGADQTTGDMLRDVVKKFLSLKKNRSNMRNKHISPWRSGTRLMSVLQPSKLTSAVNDTANTNNSSQPLILNLSQFQGSNRLIILSSQSAAPISIINNHSGGSCVIQSTLSSTRRECPEGIQSTATAADSLVTMDTMTSAPITETSEKPALSQFMSPPADGVHQQPSVTSISASHHSSLAVSPSAMDHSSMTELSMQESFDILNRLDCNSDLAVTSNDLENQMKTDSSTLVPPSCVSEKPESRMGIANITDFTPDWAYCEGGTKILVIGPWYSTTSPYSVLFDDVPVPCSLVQSGVLRCFCPAHSEGLVTMQVACEGFVISNSCAFEYKSRQLSVTEQLKEWFCTPDDQLKNSLLNLLEKVERMFYQTTHPGQSKLAQVRLSAEMSHAALEPQLVEWCHGLCKQPCMSPDSLVDTEPAGLSLLHLTAALGFAKLLNALVEWKSTDRCRVLEQQVNPLCTDGAMCTPLMWACARGQFEAAIVLYQLDNTSFNVCNDHGLLPVAVARLMGKVNVAEVLEKLDLARKEMLSSQNDKNCSNTCTDSYYSNHAGCHVSSVSDSLSKKGMSGSEGSSSQPVEVTLVKTSTGMLLTPVSEAAASSLRDTLNHDNTPVQMYMAHSVTPGSLPLNMASQDLSHASCELSADIPPPHYSAAPSVTQLPQLHPGLWNKNNVTASTQSAPSRCLRLMKHTSVEVLPDYPDPQPPTNVATATEVQERMEFKRPCERSQTEPPALQSASFTSTMRTSSSDPHLLCTAVTSTETSDPMISMSGRDLNSPVMFGQIGIDSSDTLDGLHNSSVAMETDSPESQSPLVDIDGIPPVDVYAEEANIEEVPHYQMVTLASQIIAAMPERIKASPCLGDDLLSFEAMSARDRSNSYGSFSSTCSAAMASSPSNNTAQEDSGISTPLEGMSFDEYRSDCNYGELGTPTSSLSPASSCLHSPYSFNFDSPPPTTADFTEYFNAPAFYMEKDFSKLTLTDEEQRKLYQAAQIIQNFYRRYKDKKEQKQRQLEAAVLIQSYYRRYKQYMYYKKMTQAAVLIQSQFRTYYAQKRFRKSREAATIIQNRYRAYREQERFKKSNSAAAIIQQRFRCHYQRKRGEQGGASDARDILDGQNTSASPVECAGSGEGVVAERATTSDTSDYQRDDLTVT